MKKSCFNGGNAEKRKRLFVVAFIGLLLDFLCGIGFVLCMFAGVCATVDAVRTKRVGETVTSRTRWTVSVGYVGAGLGAIFFILMV